MIILLNIQRIVRAIYLCKNEGRSERISVCRQTLDCYALQVFNYRSPSRRHNDHINHRRQATVFYSHLNDVCACSDACRGHDLGGWQTAIDTMRGSKHCWLVKLMRPITMDHREECSYPSGHTRRVAMTATPRIVSSHQLNYTDYTYLLQYQYTLVSK